MGIPAKSLNVHHIQQIRGDYKKLQKQTEKKKSKNDK